MTRSKSPRRPSVVAPDLTPYHREAIAAEAAGSSAARQGGALQALLDASRTYAALPRRAHTPRFSLEPLTPAKHARGSEWFYIRDSSERIGLIQTWTKEIEMFRFFPAGAGAGPQVEVPEFYHWGNLIGARIQMYGTQMLPPVTSFKLSFTKDRGDSLVLKLENHHEGGIIGTSEYRLTWDERLGYVWNCVSDYTMPKPVKIEFNNLLAGGVSESREDHKRWQKTVRAVADGRIVFVHHNPLNMPTDDMQARGFVGYVTEEAMNPFVELIETSDRVSIVTCSQWYDQHMILNPPAAGAAAGPSHVWARYRFLSLPGTLAREVEAVAVPAHGARGASGLGFLLNRTNDFEQLMTSEGVYNGGLWQHVTRGDKEAHSGRYSLQVNGQGTAKESALAPIGGGTAVVGESAKRYRLTVWVKTDLRKGSAYLRVDDVLWNWEDIRGTRKSRELTGRNGWTLLTLDFQPSAHDPFLVVRLCVKGDGSAWFDDVMLADLAAK